MNKHLALALMSMGLGATTFAAVEPLLWISDFNFLEKGETSMSISGGAQIQREGLKNFVSLDGRNFNILSGLPNGSAFGDIRFSFSLRPRDDQFRLEIPVHLLTGGSRRFRRDMLHNIKVLIDKDRVFVTPTYVRDKQYEDIRHMTSAPRDHGEGLPPFPEIQSGSYDLPKDFRWKIGHWHAFEIVLDQYLLTVAADGRELARHAINPGSGGLNLTSFGAVDYADFEIREIRPAFDPYLPENMLTEKTHPIRTKPIDIPPKTPPANPEPVPAQGAGNAKK